MWQTGGLGAGTAWRVRSSPEPGDTGTRLSEAQGGAAVDFRAARVTPPRGVSLTPTGHPKFNPVLTDFPDSVQSPQETPQQPTPASGAGCPQPPSMLAPRSRSWAR